MKSIAPFAPRTWLSASMLALLLHACSGGDGASNPFTSGALAVRKITITAGETESDFASGTMDYQLRSFSLDAPGRLQIDGSGVRRIVVNGVERELVADQPIAVAALTPGARIDIQLQGSDGASLTYRFGIPSDIPEFVVTADNPLPGRILLTATTASPALGRSFLLILDESGRLAGFRSNALPVADFQLQRLASGVERHVFCEWDPLIFVVKESTGSCYLLDAALRITGKLTGKASPVNPKGLTDHHEILVLESDHYIVAAYVTKVVDNIPTSLLGVAPGPRTVVPSVIQEIRAGQVVFEWDGSAFPEFYTSAVNDNDFANPNGRAEYMHLNSMQVDNDGHLLVSFRHNSQVVKIHRTTGQILWRLGGSNSDFALAAGQRFSLQHFARRTADGGIGVFDNGNLNTPRISRALLYRLDEARRSLTEFVSVSDQGIYGFATGSAQFLASDRVFVGWGVVPANTIAVSEIDRLTGQSHFTLRFTNPDYSAYRAIKIPR